jgi:hypothetical protein
VSETAPIPFEWTGDVMRPRGTRALLACDRVGYQKGLTYWLTEEHGRSRKSHNHLFAWLDDAWLNLPEYLSDEYPTPTALRKRALIQAGYYDEQIVDAGDPEAALRVAAWAKSSREEDFSLIIVRDNFVVQRRAKSQTINAMGTTAFRESKQAVLEIVSELLGITPDELKMMV